MRGDWWDPRCRHVWQRYFMGGHICVICGKTTK